MKYIDAEKLLAEIERLKEPYRPFLSDFEDGCIEGRNDVLDDIFSFITSLQQEQSEESTETKSEDGGWKPTEQQLRCLGYAIQKYEPYEAKHHVLTDLYEDLKKLM